MAAILNELITFIQAEFVTDPSIAITADMPLISSGVIDSFSFVSLQRFIERQFGVSVPDACINADEFDTVLQMSALIEQLKTGA